MTRRLFQHFTLFVAPLVYASGAVIGAVKFLSPLPTKPRQKKLDAGPVTDYPPGGVPKEFLFNDRKVFVLHDGEAIRAYDAQCTHLACNVNLPRRDPSSGFHCTCHGARFNRVGAPLPGSPTKVPLDEYELGDLTAGQVVVLDRVKPRAT